jgi:hypothetical protein
LPYVQRLTAQAYAYAQATPYHAVMPMVRVFLGLTQEATPAQQLGQIRSALAAITPALAEEAPLLARFLAIPVDTSHLPVLAPPPLPASLQGIIQARLDRLPAHARHVLQVAAVIGLEVPFSLLRVLLQLSAVETVKEIEAIPGPFAPQEAR